MWSSTTTTSSTLPCHCLANMPMVAEPQPTRMRSSVTPLTTGALARLHHHGRAAVDRELDRLAVAELHQRVAGDAALLLRSAGEMVDAAERKHLRAVFAGRDMTDRLALRAHGRGFRTEIAVGVDLHLDAAIAEDAFGHDRDHVDAVDLRGHDEGRRLVVGIGGSGTDRGHERARSVDDLAVPVATGLKRHQPAAMRDRALQDDVRIDAHQLAIVVGVAIAGAGRARLDVAHHRAGIAADLVGNGTRCVGHVKPCQPNVRRHASIVNGAAHRSYTNDVAREAKTCQAPRRAKSLTAA